jgi:hypothetical protein
MYKEEVLLGGLLASSATGKVGLLNCSHLEFCCDH